MPNLTTIISVAGASFAASFVEAVEALTVVLAVGLARGWRPALTGAAAALAGLALIVAILGPLMNVVPLHALQFVVGVLTLAATSVTWFNAITLPYALIALFLLVAMVAYYLAWKYVVGYVNQVLGLA